jgi:hypothetical protein
MGFQADLPMTALEMFAAHTHEVFESLCSAGFTSEQAMQLVIAFIQSKDGVE